MKGTSSLSKLNSIAPLPADSNCVIGGDVVLIRVLAFMTDLLRDLECLQKRRKAASLDPSVINVSGLYVLEYRTDGKINCYTWSGHM